jgi:anti-sigma-K factor RskA
VNLQEYIASGILEAYVLGELSEQQRLEVEKNLARYPELRDALAIVEEIQEALLMKAAINPRSSLKAEIIKDVQSSPASKVVPLTPEANESLWKFAAAASILLAITASYFAYDFHSKWQRSENNLTELMGQNQRMAKDYNEVNQKIDRIETDLKVINSPAFSRVVMKGLETTPEALATVYWNAASKEVYLSIQNMKVLAQENQYQLWAIVDGKPVDAGVFDSNLNGLLKMKDIPNGAIKFAVTIEPRGGKETPTMSTMQVIGDVIKG